MTLLQPLDVPSRTGINNAITSEIEDHADVADTTGDHYDSGWLTLPGAPGAGVTITTKEYRIKSGMVQIRFAGTLAGGGLSVPISGNMTDIHIGDLPAGARPGGGGIASSTAVPVEIGGSVIFALIYNGGSVNLAYADSRNVAYTLGAAGTTVSCISPLYTINS